MMEAGVQSVGIAGQVSQDPTPKFGAGLRPSPRRESAIFWRLRALTLRATFRHMLQTARLRSTLVLLLSFFFWFGLLVLFLEGFRFLEATYDETVQTLFSIFFASLMVMLLFSSGIILYSGLFASREAAFLMTLPVRTERVFWHKFQESLWFSSWGFILLGSPMLVAYGIIADAPWNYFALLLPFMLAFVSIPAGVGAACCLLIVYWMPRIRLHVLGLLGGALLLAVVLITWSLVSSAESNLLTPRWFQEISARLRIAEARLLPSWWLSAGLLEASRRSYVGTTSYQPWAHSFMFLAVLVSNALMAQLVAVWIARRTYRAGYSRLHADRPARRRVRPSIADGLIMKLAIFVPREIRLLLVKDFRLFRRDPVQWTQFLIFFALLGLYFVNIRRFSYDVNYTSYVNMVGFLNLAVIGLILSTFTTRFIFPMISLEGRRFWILGRLPIARSTIIWGKFMFAAVGATVPSVLLILLSDVMLRLPATIVFVHQVVCLALCLGLSGLAVGLGAAMPDLKQADPSKIAAGFGGTLNLVLSALYIIAMVFFTAYRTHLWLVYPSQHNTIWLGAAVLGAAICGLAVTVIPLAIGLRAFQKIEF